MIRFAHLRSALLLALLGLLCLPSLALGHAELVSSEPPDGGTISEPPYELSAEFSEELAADSSRIVVRDSAGNEVARGSVSESNGAVMTVDLSDVAPGDYVARWTAVTPDDNGITRGNIEFTIAHPASPTASASSTPSGQPTGSPTVAPETPLPTASPSATLSASPSPSPTGGGTSTGSTSDLLIALVVAGALVAGLVFFLWRRRNA